MPIENHDWPSIVALNSVSMLAQVGQFGIPFVVLPLWLAQHGADTLQLSLFASSLWLGQFPGLALAPRLTQRYSAKAVIGMSLLATALALVAMALGLPALWIPAAILAGFGQGLRWIGLEPWLYRIAPGHACGKLIGFHETLIALAPIAAPFLSAWWGVEGNAPLWLGIAFVLVAAVPLLWAHEVPITVTSLSATASESLFDYPKEKVFILGAGIALVGGMSEAAFIGLFPIFGQENLWSAEQIANLLTTFGLGGLLFQYLAGWLADHRGMVFTTLCCTVFTAIFSVVLTFDLNPQMLHAAVFCLGGLVTAYLTLALIASAKTQGGNMSRNMSLISIIYTLSAVAGPLLGGTAVNALGGNGLMWALATFAVAMTVCLARMGTKR